MTSKIEFVKKHYQSAMIQLAFVKIDGDRERLIFCGIQFIPKYLGCSDANFESFSKIKKGRVFCLRHSVSIEDAFSIYEEVERNRTITMLWEEKKPTVYLVSGDLNKSDFVISKSIKYVKKDIVPSRWKGAQIESTLCAARPKWIIEKIDDERTMEWLSKNLCWNIEDNLEFLCGVVLLFPNPYYCRSTARLNMDEKRSDSEIVEISFDRDCSSHQLRLYFIDENAGEYGCIKDIRIKSNKIGVSLRYLVDCVGYIVVDNKGHIVEHANFAPFVRNIKISVEGLRSVRKFVCSDNVEQQIEQYEDDYTASIGAQSKPQELKLTSRRLKALFYRKERKLAKDQKIYYKEAGKAERFLRDIISKANDKIIIIDPYFSDAASDMYLEASRANVEIYCTEGGLNISNGRDDVIDHGVELKKKIDTINREKQRKIDVYVVGHSDLHDRFVVIDDKEAWLVGSSLKDIGASLSVITKLRDASGVIKGLREFIAEMNSQPLDDWMRKSRKDRGAGITQNSGTDISPASLLERANAKAGRMRPDRYKRLLLKKASLYHHIRSLYFENCLNRWKMNLRKDTDEDALKVAWRDMFKSADFADKKCRFWGNIDWEIIERFFEMNERKGLCCKSFLLFCRELATSIKDDGKNFFDLGYQKQKVGPCLNVTPIEYSFDGSMRCCNIETNLLHLQSFYLINLVAISKVDVYLDIVSDISSEEVRCYVLGGFIDRCLIKERKDRRIICLCAIEAYLSNGDVKSSIVLQSLLKEMMHMMESHPEKMEDVKDVLEEVLRILVKKTSWETIIRFMAWCIVSSHCLTRCECKYQSIWNREKIFLNVYERIKSCIAHSSARPQYTDLLKAFGITDLPKKEELYNDTSTINDQGSFALVLIISNELGIAIEDGDRDLINRCVIRSGVVCGLGANESSLTIAHGLFRSILSMKNATSAFEELSAYVEELSYREGFRKQSKERSNGTFGYLPVLEVFAYTGLMLSTNFCNRKLCECSCRIFGKVKDKIVSAIYDGSPRDDKIKFISEILGYIERNSQDNCSKVRGEEVRTLIKQNLSIST